MCSLFSGSLLTNIRTCHIRVIQLLVCLNRDTVFYSDGSMDAFGITIGLPSSMHQPWMKSFLKESVMRLKHYLKHGWVLLQFNIRQNQSRWTWDTGVSPRAFLKIGDDAFVINWARTFIKEFYPATLSKCFHSHSFFT